MAYGSVVRRNAKALPCSAYQARIALRAGLGNATDADIIARIVAVQPEVIAG
jgi:hypothetical protein